MPVGKPFIELFEVDSTNNYAMAQVQAALADGGTAWFAHTQFSGKGQRNKTWFSDPGQNIIISIALTPADLHIEKQFLLSATVAVACLDLMNAHAPGRSAIKWPNDIYWGDRKAGGILIENVLMGQQWRFAIVGVGINVNQLKFQPGLLNPVSLSQITGKSYNVVELAKSLCNFIDFRYGQLMSGNHADVLATYHQSLYKLHEWVTLKIEGETTLVKIEGVNERGELLITTLDGHEMAVKQAEWIFN